MALLWVSLLQKGNNFNNIQYGTGLILLVISVIQQRGLLGANCFNSSPPGQNSRHFADDIFRCIFVNEKFCILMIISLNFVPQGPIDKKPALI